MGVREVVCESNAGDVRATGERIARYVGECRHVSLTECARAMGVGTRALTECARGIHKPAVRTLVALWEEGGRVLDLHWLLTGEGEMCEEGPLCEPSCDPMSETMRVRALARALGMSTRGLLEECGWPGNCAGAIQGHSYVSCDVLWYLHRRWPNLDLQWVLTGTRSVARRTYGGWRKR